jgi:hypothetical protein
LSIPGRQARFQASRNRPQVSKSSALIGLAVAILVMGLPYTRAGRPARLFLSGCVLL